MLCQNCGNNEANFRYTQIINGVKKEIALCSNCAKEIGIDKIDIPDFPISFNSFLGDFFNDYAEHSLLPSFQSTAVKCKKCGTTYDDFIDKGLFGCSDCYDTFSNPIDSLLKNLHGTAKHIGRGINNFSNVNDKINGEIKKSKNEKVEDNQKINTDNQKEDLQKQLEKAIAEERYEDAAIIRDKMKGGE